MFDHSKTEYISTLPDLYHLVHINYMSVMKSNAFFIFTKFCLAYIIIIMDFLHLPTPSFQFFLLYIHVLLDFLLSLLPACHPTIFFKAAPFLTLFGCIHSNIFWNHLFPAFFSHNQTKIIVVRPLLQLYTSSTLFRDARVYVHY